VSASVVIVNTPARSKNWEDVRSFVELRWRSGDHQAALTVSSRRVGASEYDSDTQAIALEVSVAPAA
jgi:hypothetical protein